MTSIQRSNLMLYACVLCYALYLYSGLILLILPILHKFISNELLNFIRETIPSLSWRLSVFTLACGHNFHAIYWLGLRDAVIFFVWGVIVCITLEEIGLRTGCVFGWYAFTDALGYRITERLPLMIPIMWQCFSYPCLLLAQYMIDAWASTRLHDTTTRVKPIHIHIHVPSSQSKPQSQTKSPSRLQSINFFIKISMLAAFILVGFDCVSEPVSVSQGHRLWEYLAWNPQSDISSYIPQPDWQYREHDAYIKYYEGIPISNFFGWLFVGFVTYMGYLLISSNLCLSEFNVTPILTSGREKNIKNRDVKTRRYGNSNANLNSTFTVTASSSKMVSAMLYLNFLPPFVSIYCTQIFYIVHIGHASYVRILGTVYLVILTTALVLPSFLQGSHVKK